MKPSLVSEKTFEDFLGALLDGDMPKCRRIVETLLEQDVEIADLYRNLFHRAQYAIGELWELNRISVAREHLATSITESLMTLVYPRLFRRERVGKRAVISSGPNEYHQVGGKMVADIFESHGWDGYFLGANSTEDRLLEEVRKRDPDLLAFSVALPASVERLRAMLRRVRTEFPSLPVLIGGKAIADGVEDDFSDVPSVTVMTTLEELESFLHQGEAHAVHGIRH